VTTESIQPLWRCLCLFVLLLGSMNSRADAFTDSLPLLNGSYDDKATAVQMLLASGDSRSEAALKSLLDGQLYSDKKTDAIVRLLSDDPDVKVQDLAGGQEYEVNKRGIKRIGINNALRGDIRLALASMALVSPDQERRLQAVRSLMGDLEPQLRERLIQLQISDKSADVREAIAVALAIDLVNQNQPLTRAVVDTLGGSLEPQARNALQTLSDREGDSAIGRLAQKALASIDQKIIWSGYIETLFFGLSLGSVLVLAAIGLAITFGVMGIINMAHGELIMLGAYTTYVIQLLMPDHIGLSIMVAVPAAFVVSGLMGILIERSVIRFLYGRPLETLLATFGISLILQQLVRSIFSPLNRSVSTPEWMTGSLQLSPILSLTWNRLYIIIFCLIVFALLFVLLKKTRLGLQVRAVSQNRGMARAMGVRSSWVDAMTFGLGSGIAGVAGVALSQLTNVGPNLGQAYIIDSFMVVVFGGVGNLWGTLVAGLSLGVANKLLEPAAGAVLAKILVLVFIILFIQKFPRGLFPQKGRSAEG
jgi:urea transport system permease protein